MTVRVRNDTTLSDDFPDDRDEALLRALVSSHVILDVRDGAFVSLMDPPAHWRDIADGCQNIGTWPVLVGEPGSSDTMLASPIILYDHPQVAPDSRRDLFDATEIDEILTLRILTLTEDTKKLGMIGVDDCAWSLLVGTESPVREQMMGLHGTIRGLRPLDRGDPGSGAS